MVEKKILIMKIEGSPKNWKRHIVKREFANKQKQPP